MIRFACFVALASAPAGMAHGASTVPADASLPDTFMARLEVLASMETLNADLLASRSATKTLEGWCATHAMAADPKIIAVRAPGPDKPLDEAQRRRLQIEPDDQVRYRHVRLTCGDRVLSEADNWYLPSRLTPEMNRKLDTSEAPFGEVVAPLQPTRRTFAAEVLWTILRPGWEHLPRPADHPDRLLAIPPILFEHHAVLYDSSAGRSPKSTSITPGSISRLTRGLERPNQCCRREATQSPRLDCAGSRT